jgi:hypothetical protein
MKEVTNRFVFHLLVIISLRSFLIFWFCYSQELSPLLIVSNELVREVFEEGLMVISKLVLRKSDDVEPCLLIHPIDLLVAVINTGSSLEEHAYIGRCEESRLDHNFEGNLEFEGNLIFFEKTTVDVSVHPTSHPLDNVCHTILNKLCLWTLVNTEIEKIQELLEGTVVHPVDE